MDYHVTIFPKKEFLRLWDLVLLAKEGIKPAERMPVIPLRKVSDSIGDVPERERPAISQSEYVGMYYHDGQIWLKPDVYFHDMQDTVLHELAHHEVPGEAHGRTWRKVFGTALVLHFREVGFDWDYIRAVLHSDVIEPNRIPRTVLNFEQREQNIKKEVDSIIRHAKKKIPVLTKRGKY